MGATSYFVFSQRLERRDWVCSLSTTTHAGTLPRSRRTPDVLPRPHTLHLSHALRIPPRGPGRAPLRVQAKRIARCNACSSRRKGLLLQAGLGHDICLLAITIGGTTTVRCVGLAHRLRTLARHLSIPQHDEYPPAGSAHRASRPPPRISPDVPLAIPPAARRAQRISVLCCVHRPPSIAIDRRRRR
jgi:hypothetical protein